MALNNVNEVFLEVVLPVSVYGDAVRVYDHLTLEMTISVS